MAAFGNVLRGETENSTILRSMSPATILNFKNAPIVTVDIERCFSGLSRILIPQRERLTLENLKYHLIVMWNKISNYFKYFSTYFQYFIYVF